MEEHRAEGLGREQRAAGRGQRAKERSKGTGKNAGPFRRLSAPLTSLSLLPFPSPLPSALCPLPWSTHLPSLEDTKKAPSAIG